MGWEDYKERVYALGIRLGIPRSSIEECPATMWQIPFLEKMLDAIEKLEESNARRAIDNGRDSEGGATTK